MTDPNTPGGYPPPPGQGGGYGSYAPMPPEQQPYGYGTPPPPAGPPPAPVVNAFRLMLVSAALGVISLVVALGTKSSLRATIRDKYPDYTAKQLTDAVNAAIVFAVVVSVIFIVLYLLLAMQVRKGRNWARIVTWVITGLGVISALASLGQPETGGSKALSLIAGLVDLVIIILLMQSVSHEYFRRGKRSVR